MYDADNQFSAMGMSRQQMAILSQIEKSVVSMYHIDELFQWLANALIHYFNIQLLLFWTNRVNQTGQLVAQLRTIARQDSSVPEQIVVNDQVQAIAQRLMNERLTYEPQPLETLFSHYQTVLLKRYGLHYWSVCFTSKNALLPPRLDAFTRQETPAFLAMTTLLFLHQPIQPGTLPTISFILEKSLDLALARRLLLSTAEPQTRPLPNPQSSYAFPATPFPSSDFPPGPSSLPGFPANTSYTFPATPPSADFSSSSQPLATPPPPFSQEPEPMHDAPPVLTHLIPSRKQDADLLLATNPFAHSVAISDKKARRLHTAIDGQANVAQLCSITGLSIQEVSVALRMLWDQHRIEVHEPGGKAVNLPFFL